MKTKKNIFWLIFFLSFLVSLLIAWKFFISQKTKEKTPTYPSPSPFLTPVFTPTPTPFLLEEITPLPAAKEGKGDTVETILNSLKKRFPLVEYLPYETDDFIIDYIAPFHLQVKIKRSVSRSLITKEVLNWIISKDVDPQTHQIDFVYLSSVTPVP